MKKTSKFLSFFCAFLCFFSQPAQGSWDWFLWGAKLLATETVAKFTLSLGSIAVYIIGDLWGTTHRIEKKLDALKKETDENFDKVNKKIDTLETNLKTVIHKATQETKEEVKKSSEETQKEFKNIKDDILPKLKTDLEEAYKEGNLKTVQEINKFIEGYSKKINSQVDLLTNSQSEFIKSINLIKDDVILFKNEVIKNFDIKVEEINKKIDEQNKITNQKLKDFEQILEDNYRNFSNENKKILLNLAEHENKIDEKLKIFTTNNESKLQEILDKHHDIEQQLKSLSTISNDLKKELATSLQNNNDNLSKEILNQLKIVQEEQNNLLENKFVSKEDFEKFVKENSEKLKELKEQNNNLNTQLFDINSTLNKIQKGQHEILDFKNSLIKNKKMIKKNKNELSILNTLNIQQKNVLENNLNKKYELENGIIPKIKFKKKQIKDNLINFDSDESVSENE